MSVAAISEKRQELARVLRQMRARIRPPEVGLAEGSRRRVPGLRRHELADLAGISLTWYTWLEQGRDIPISAHALDAVALALRSDDDQRRHLRVLADIPDPTPLATSREVDESLRALIDDLLPSPVAITSPAWDFLAWNRAWTKVFIDLGAVEPHRRNGLWITFMSAEYRKRLVHWESEARLAVSRHREISAPYTEDERLRELRAELSQASPEFRDLWEQREVRRFVGRIQKVQHPDVGLLQFRFVELSPVDAPAIKLVIRRPYDAATRDRLATLLDT